MNRKIHEIKEEIEMLCAKIDRGETTIILAVVRIKELIHEFDIRAQLISQVRSNEIQSFFINNKGNVMSKGINKVIIVGNLGNDPEQKAMPNGNAVTNITVATSESWKDKNTGQKQERTEWHRIVFFNRLAEIAGQYLTKGAKVYIEGRLRTRKWQDSNGNDRYTTEIVASEMQMLDSKQSSSQQSSNNAPQQQAPQQQEANTDYDDDIPF